METTKCRINCALLSPSLCSMEILICRFLAISADYSSLFNSDGKNDIQAGLNAGCHTALIGTDDFGQEMTANSLLDFTKKCL